MRPALFLLLASLPALAADPFEGLKRLDRVVVTDRDGDTVRGIVRSIVKGRLSIQLEGREGLSGSLVFERKSVRKVEKAGTATEEELKAASEPPPSLEGLVEPERPAPKAEPPPAKPRPVLEAFPPAEWSGKRREEIAFLSAAEIAQQLVEMTRAAGVRRAVPPDLRDDSVRARARHRRSEHRHSVLPGRVLDGDRRPLHGRLELE